MRHSLDFEYGAENAPENNAAVMSPHGPSHGLATPPKLQSSYSASDVPTVKSPSGLSLNNHAQQHFHNHNASIGRIPAGAVSARHTREMSNDSNLGQNRDQNGGYPSINSALQASAAPFGPSTTAPAPIAPSTVMPAAGMAPAVAPFNGFYSQPAQYGPPNGQTGNTGNTGYNMNMMTAGMQQMNMNGGNMYPAQNYNGYSNMSYHQATQPRDSQARVMRDRRQPEPEGKLL